MFTAFKLYLLTLKLSPVSRKLYLSDVRRFLNWLRSITPSITNEPSLDQLSSTNSYTSYLNSLRDEAIAPSMLKRTVASLKQFGTFLALTYNVSNPMSNLSISPSLPINAISSSIYNYIKHFTNYLKEEHLSPHTIKSYKSDITRYLDWASTNIPSTSMDQMLTNKNIQIYLNHLSESGDSLPSTIERKAKSIARLQAWYTKVYGNTQVSDNNSELSHTRYEGLSHTGYVIPTNNPLHDPDVGSKPVKKDDSRKRLISLFPYLSTPNVRNFAILTILMIFAASLGIFGYRQFSRDASLTAAFPSTPITPNRQLSFQGRLENAAGTPISSATNMTFKLYDTAGTGHPPTGGTQLYTSGVCSITPDADGVFSTQIGGTCGSAIASTVFSENANVWLEVTVVSDVLDPRQQIASVAYALNSETLQGFPISSTVSAIRNTVVPMNQWGEIIIGEQNPRMKGVSGTFQISAPSLSFITTAGSNGNISLSPDGTGQINLTGNTTNTNFFNVSNAQLTTGSLITGTVGNANTGYKLIDLLSGVSPTSKFSVTDTGLTTIAADLYVGSGISLYNTAVTDDTIEAAKFCTGDGETNCVTDFSTIVAGATYWTRTTGVLSPTNLNDVLAATTSATTAMSLTQTGAFNALLVEDQTSDTTPFVIDQSGNVGIGTPTPTATLDISSSASTGNSINLASNSLSSGKALNISSTSTALTTGGLASLDWSPGSSTTSTGDLFSLNIGANGSANTLFNIKDTGASLFSVSETTMTSNLPSSFTSPGDVSMAYDLIFTNPTLSNIKSAAPLTISAGETFNSSDLTLQSYNAGDVIADTGTTGTFKATGTTTFNNLIYTWPASHTATGVLQNNGTGTLTWATLGAASITPDSLDYTEFKDTMTYDADLIINQAGFTGTNNFTGTTATAQTINANSLSSGSALKIVTTATTTQTGNLLDITSAQTSGTGSILGLTSSGVQTAGSMLAVVGNSATTVTNGLVNIAGNALTTGSALKVTSTGTTTLTGNLVDVSSAMTSASGNIMALTASGVKTAGGILSVVGNSATTVTNGLVNIAGNALTTGSALKVTSTGTTTLTGNLVDLSFADTSGTGSILGLTSSGVQTAGSMLAVVGNSATTVTNGLVNIAGNALTTGSALKVTSTGTTTLTGNLVDVSSSMTSASGNIMALTATGVKTAGGILSVVGNSATTVTNGLVNIAGNALTTGSALKVTSTGTTTLTGNLVDVSSAMTSASGNIMALTASGIKTAGGILSVVGNSATTVTNGLVNIAGNALTTGSALKVTSTGTTALTGNLVDVSSAMTSASGNIMALTATGIKTAGSILSIVGDSATTTTNGLARISGNALTTGELLALTSSSAAFTGNLLHVDLSGTNAANTGTLVKISSAITNTGTPLMVTNLSAGISLRVNDETGDADATPFVIDTSGNVGIGTATPGQKLDVVGAIQFSNALMPNATAGIAGQMLTSAGPGAVPTWTTPSAGVAADSLDYVDFQDTMDFDADLITNQTTFTDTYNFTGTTTVGHTYNANSLTTGTDLLLSSTSNDGGLSGLSKVLDIVRSGTNTNASHTAYGIYSNVTNTGTTSTNVAGYFSATGATDNYAGIFASGRVGIGDTTPDALLDLDSTATTTNDFGITNTGIFTGTGTSSVAQITANSATSGDIMTISGTGLTTGSGLVMTGSSATPGATDALLKISGNLGNIGISNGLISSTATITSAVGTDRAANLYLNTTNTTGTASKIFGINANLTDTSGLSSFNYGISSQTSMLGANTTAKVNYGVLSLANSTNSNGGDSTTYGYYAATTNTQGTDAGVANQYGVYIANGFGTTNGTSTKYGLYIEDQATSNLADNNYAAVFAGGNVGIGTASPSQLLDVAGRIWSTGNITTSTSLDALINITGTLTGSANGQSSFRARNTISTSATGNVSGIDVVPTFNTSANITTVRGAVLGGFFNPATTTTITNADAVNSVLVFGAAAAGAITNAHTIYVNSPVQLGTVYPTNMYGIQIQNQGLSGMTNNYGLYVDAQSGATNNYAAIFAGGNVGIGVAAPTAKLSITDSTTTTGNVEYSLASAITSGSMINLEQTTSTFTGNSIYANMATTGTFSGKFLRFDNATNTKFSVDSAGTVLADIYGDTAGATTYLNSNATTTSLAIAGDIKNTDNSVFTIASNLASGNNIIIDPGSGNTVLIGTTGAEKLDAGTIDPPYTINGGKFATYMAGMTGVKEETTGNIIASEYISGVGYRATLDLANSPEGSDIWLFGKSTNLKSKLDKMVVLLSSSGNTKTWYDVEPVSGKLYLYALSPTTISYRLTAPRYDAMNWFNTRTADSISTGHIINENDPWSVSTSIADIINSGKAQIATIFGNVETNLISPQDPSQNITIAAPVVIAPVSSDSPALTVNGEIDASSISARTAKLNDIQAETITARNIIADTISANHIEGLDAKIASMSGNLSDTEITTITDRIKARLDTLTGNIATAADLPVPDLASPSAIIASASTLPSTASDSAMLSMLDADFVTINNYLAVIGTATITTLDVTNSLYTNTINSKDSRLALQPMGGIINLAGNTLIVDSTGEVMINGNLTVSGKILAESASINSLELGTPNASSSALGKLLAVYNEQGVAIATIDASGSANFADLSTRLITIASASDATPSSSLLTSSTTSNATAGESVLISPDTELTISSPYVTKDTLVYLTPTTNTDNKVLFVKAKESCTTATINCTPSFTVAIDAPASSNISFNWWIIQLAPPKTEGNL